MWALAPWIEIYSSSAKHVSYVFWKGTAGKKSSSPSDISYSVTMVEIVKRKGTVNWPASEANMNELWDDFFSQITKNASCTIDYLAFLNWHCKKFCEFMRLRSCKYEHATALDSQYVMFFEIFKSMGTCMRVTSHCPGMLTDITFNYRNSPPPSSSFGRKHSEWCSTVQVDKLQKILMTILEEEGCNDVLLR